MPPSNSQRAPSNAASRVVRSYRAAYREHFGLVTGFTVFASLIAVVALKDHLNLWGAVGVGSACGLASYLLICGFFLLLERGK